MKILAVADLHARWDWCEWITAQASQFDLVTIAGDLVDTRTRKGSPMPLGEQIRQASRWLIGLPIPVVVCTGNHDGPWLPALCGRGQIIAVDGCDTTVAGQRIQVVGWGQIPNEAHCDVLVMHAPPSGCACAAQDGRDLGDGEVLDLSTWPRVILSGHVHAPRALSARVPWIEPRSTVLVPGHEEAACIPPHWVVDLGSGQARHSSGLVVSI